VPADPVPSRSSAVRSAPPRRLVLARIAGAVAAPLVAASLVAACGDSHAADAVSLDHARAEHEAGRALLIDIREPNEHASGVAKGAYLLPMQQLARRMSEIPADPDRPVLLICNTQNRSRATLRLLREKGGYTNVRFVEGGMSAWAKRGWPMVPPGQ
jgi:rhodanese-related sulfurtransferase